MTTPLSSPSQPINKVQKFEDFYRLFQDTPGLYKYQEQINDIFSRGGNSINILYEDLLSYDPQIAEMLRKDPESLLGDAVDAFKNILKFQSGKILNRPYFVRISTRDKKSPLTVPIRKLRASDIDKLVWFNGITIRSSTIRPKLIKATFECNLCGSQFEVIQLTSSIRWAKFCINKRCKAKAQADFRLISKKSEFIDWQSISIQEIPEDLPSGRIPRSIQAILTHDLVDYVKPGDRVKVMGIYKSVLASSTKNINSTLFRTFIDVNFIDPEDKSEDLIEFSKEDKKTIEKLSKEPLIQKKIMRSIAPNIYGREDLKLACALSLFGGTKRKKPGGGYKRGDIHVLFVGDPGTGKSIYGDEEIYIGIGLKKKIEWKKNQIGLFIDDLFQKNLSNVIKTNNTEILKLNNTNKLYTQSINPKNLKTQVVRIKEVSKHKSNTLLKIKTKSGRLIRASPDHSFVTLIEGKFKPISGKELKFNYQKKRQYLPIARNLNFGDELKVIDIKDYLNGAVIVNTKTIREQTSLYRSGILTLKSASKISNITQNTLLLYEKNQNKLPKGEWIRTKNNNVWTPRMINLDEKFGRIIGFYLAEGDKRKNTIRISNTNPEIIQLLKEDIIKIFGKVSYYDYEDSIQIHNAIFSNWILKCFNKYAQGKKIPAKFLSTPRTFRKGLLASYFTGDGCIERGKLFIEATTASKALVYSISDMLSTFGIFCTIGTRILKSGKYEGNKYYNIILTGIEVIKFYQKIGFLSSDKQIILEEAIKISSKTTRYQKKDIIPNFGNLLQKITSELGLRSIKGTSERNFLAELRGKKQRQRAGRVYLKRISKKLEELYNQKRIPLGYNLKWLKILTKSDIFWDEIDTIDIIDEITDVYDIAAEDGHFIVANGNLIVHNSEILKNTIDISPRGLYTSGKGSSAVGLTAAVIKDSETGQMNLEAGVIVLANGGVAAIDEFDKMDTADRSALHEGLEQQTVSIAKAGIVATLKAETAVIAAANPHSGRYDRYKTPTQNIRMPPSLLSRFDLIFVVVDRPDKADDAQLAEFILQNSMGKPEEDFDENSSSAPPISGDLLKKYIRHAKRTCFPTLSEEAKEEIKEFYLELRGESDNEEAIVSILARNLDALVRMSEAYAKMALRDTVTKQDVEEIIKLFKRFLQDTGYDTETGKIDMDRLFIGESRSKINKLEKLLNRLKELFEENNWKELEISDVIGTLELEEGLDSKFIRDALEELLRDGTLYEPKSNHIKFTPRRE